MEVAKGFDGSSQVRSTSIEGTSHNTTILVSEGIHSTISEGQEQLGDITSGTTIGWVIKVGHSTNDIH